MDGGNGNLLNHLNGGIAGGGGGGGDSNGGGGGGGFNGTGGTGSGAGGLGGASFAAGGTGGAGGVDNVGGQGGAGGFGGGGGGSFLSESAINPIGQNQASGTGQVTIELLAASPLPEPGSLALTLGALLSVAFARRNGKSRVVRANSPV